MPIDSRHDYPEPLPTKPKRKGGFATLSPEKVRELASKGGKAAHAQGKAHHFTSEEAKAAGRLGGHAARRNRDAREAEAEEKVDNHS